MDDTTYLYYLPTYLPTIPGCFFVMRWILIPAVSCRIECACVLGDGLGQCKRKYVYGVGQCVRWPKYLFFLFDLFLLCRILHEFW